MGEGPRRAAPGPPQTWALAIATYNRPDVLFRCLALAAGQSRPPLEIAVVDSSDEWQASRDRVLSELRPRYPDITWRYEQARARSKTVQRNQVCDLCSADVLFVVDDDSLLAPECAARVMEVYDLDTEGQVAGVSPILTNVPPDAPEGSERGAGARPDSGSGGWGRALKGRLKRWLRVDETWIPYDRRYPDLELPAALRSLPVGRFRLMHGARMTFRRRWVQQERFDENIRAGGDDLDLSYRISRHGCFVQRFDAKLCHLEAPTGRESLRRRSYLATSNVLALSSRHCPDRDLARRRCALYLLRRLLVGLLHDLSKANLELPRAHGVLDAARWYPALMRAPADEAARMQRRIQYGEEPRGETP